MAKRIIKRPLFADRVLERRKERRWRRWNLCTRLALLLLIGFSVGLQYRMDYLRRHHITPNTSISGEQHYDNAKDNDGMPTVLNVNGERWVLLQVNGFTGESHEAAASASCEMRVIWFLPSDTPSMLRNSLMHEIMHAGACLHGGDAWWNSAHPDQHSHEGVYHLAEFLTNFYRANPEFMQWMLK